MFMDQLDVDEDIASILAREGFASLEEVAVTHEMMEIAEFDQKLLKNCGGVACYVLLTRAIAAEERLGNARPADDLLHMDGMDEELAFTLAAADLLDMDDLAELSVDDLNEIAD